MLNLHTVRAVRKAHKSRQDLVVPHADTCSEITAFVILITFNSTCLRATSGN